jgi:GTP-binding protein EngB required for normal cell division
VVIEDHPTLGRLVGRIEYRAQMGSMLTDFTLVRPGALHCANGGYLLIDARHGVKTIDSEVMGLLDKAAVSYQVVLTKTDKIKPPAVERLIGETLEKIRKRPAAFPEVLATSSEKGSGMDDLREAIMRAAASL